MYVLELAGEDDRFAAAEATVAATGVTVIASGLATAESVDRDRVRGLAYTRRVAGLIGRTVASVERACSLLEGCPVDRPGTVAVRARDVRGTTGVDTRLAERELGAVLADNGFSIDLDAPDHELRALFADGICMLGWLEAESVRDYGDRAPTDKPFFRPGAMDPLDARAIANLCGARPGTTVLDPMCGTGGLLVEAGLLGARVVGLDAQVPMVQGAAENLAAYLDGWFAVARADATNLPLRGPVDAVVLDVPYGRQSRIEHDSLDALVAGALAEARRVTDRAVVVGDRVWSATAHETGWTVTAVYERPVHRSLVRHVHVLEDQD